jgi:hypothetical protein
MTGNLFDWLGMMLETGQSFLANTYDCASQGELLSWLRFWIVGS